MRFFALRLGALFSAACLVTGCAALLSKPVSPRASLYADYLTGRYADLQRDSGVATTRYLSALRQSPTDSVLLDGAVDTALSGGDFGSAEAAAKLALKRGAQSDLGRLTLATVFLQERQYQRAEDRVRKGDIGSFDRLAALTIRGWAMAGRGRSDGAIAALAEGTNGPFKTLFDYQRALVFDYAGKTDEALGAYRTAEVSGVRLAPALIRHGRLLERTGRVEDARVLYEDFLAGGDDPGVRAEMQRLSGETIAAVNDPLTPAHGAAIGLYSIAASLLGQSDPDFYLPYLTLAEALDPNFDAAWILYGEGMRQIKHYDSARAAYLKVAPGSAWYESAQTRISWLYRTEDRNSEALAVARALNEKTQGRDARVTLADMERANEHWIEAEALYTVLIDESAKAPRRGDWALYFARGSCRDQLGRWPEGEADLKQALLLSPDQPEVLNYLGYSWVDKGMHLDEALGLLRKAVQLDPESGYIIDSLGWAQFKLGQYDDAVDSLERAVELSPEDATLNDHLGDVYWRLKRKVEARFQWTRALTLKPTDKEKPLIERKVKEGLAVPPARRATKTGKN
jgi:tetratricopeptide (TPR) repeat protein